MPEPYTDSINRKHVTLFYLLHKTIWSQNHDYMEFTADLSVRACVSVTIIMNYETVCITRFGYSHLYLVIKSDRSFRH